MKPYIHRGLTPIIFGLPLSVAAENEGYLGYLLSQKGDPESTVYKTTSTNTAPSFILPEDPDVYLNATVDVESIRVDVADLTAKVNIDAKVLDLLHFSAGVDASVERVGLRIDDVYARAELEARLGNVVRMVNDALGSIDLNPLVAAVGKNTEKLVGSATNVVKDTTDGLLGGEAKPAAKPPGGGKGQQKRPHAGGGSGGKDETPPTAGPEKAPPQGAQQKPPGQGSAGPAKPPPQMGRKNPSNVKPHGSTRTPNPVEAKDLNILWFMPNQATGGGTYNTLASNGDILRVRCDDKGDTIESTLVGPYTRFMAPTGTSKDVKNARGQWEKATKYTHTLDGLTRVCWVYQDMWGVIARTEVEPFDWSQVTDGT